MSEAVKSFNDKIEEIKEDKEKFKVLMDEFFDSKDMNINELLAEMMFHIIMTRGAELQEKFDEIDNMRKMFTDIEVDPLNGGLITYPTYPNNYPQQWGVVTDGTWVTGDMTGAAALTGVGTGTFTVTGTQSINSSIVDSVVNVNISDVKIQNIVDSYEKISEKEYSDDSFKSAIDAISTINWSASSTG